MDALAQSIGGLDEIKGIFYDYSKELALAMFLSNEQIARRGDWKSKSNWDKFFSSSDSSQQQRIRIGLKGSPLKRMGDGYMFIHKSYQE